MKTILITGTSGGLGLEIAVQSAMAGYRTYATMRDTRKRAALERALAAAGVKAEVLALDVQDQTSIDTVVSRILSDCGQIDVLVNNAGAGYVRTLEQARDADIEWVLDVNLRGVIRCTKAVLPAMRAARSGRVVTISSIGGLVGQPFNEIYCAAKFGVEGFVESLATYVGPAFGIHFTLVEPGGIASDFSASAMTHFSTTGGMHDDEYLPLLQAYMAGVQSRAGADAASSYQTPAQVAEVVLQTLAKADPPLRLRTSPWAEDITALKTASDPDGRKLRDALVQRNFGKLPLGSQ